ncbi:hypothetical protein HZQ23_08165 [Elizabethkingia anophelis]|uniref:hypothetical protein n=1 Tax=Elizabethkingia meningoseptica TaxID=238 RepID=UPI0021A293F6|nr:hypothetical protein [Elizabethkingia meningoseptica]MCT3991086.1 hypothetical protein [Elizabethkingia anophelis]EJK5329452.1 hypothetical protein [Elizabethkingia meningoseptica]MCT4008876.1 hypothetical protein [Elizabethkingia anophelis]MCT4315852.1 hypothetical protein [Elizabethkingia anophelis]MDV3928555.1 hypothetical protein [Elizabethkingia anophelis]
MTTIFESVVTFLLAEKAGIASKVLASATYDILKKSLNFSALKMKIRNMFKSDSETQQFIDGLCETPATNNYHNDVTGLYSATTGNVAPENLIFLLEEWIKENKESIEDINNIQISNSSGFNIGVQNAKRDIINIQGDYYSKEETNEN